MILSVERRCAFLSMPKCASNAIVPHIAAAGDLTALGRSELKHTPYREAERFIFPYVEERLGIARDGFTVVCLFREPLDWLHSWYRYRSRRALANPRHKHHFRYTGEMSFDAFVAGWLSTERPPYARVGSQAEFVLAEDGTVGPDLLFRYEELGAALRRIGEMMGRKIKPRRVNVSPRRKLELGADMRGRLEEALRRDYEIYESIGRRD